MIHLDPAVVVALVGTIMGGVGLKLVEWFLGRNKIKVDDATTIRNELRLEIMALRKENSELEADVVKWREKYFQNYELLIKTQTHFIIHGLDPPNE